MTFTGRSISNTIKYGEQRDYVLMTKAIILTIVLRLQIFDVINLSLDASEEFREDLTTISRSVRVLIFFVFNQYDFILVYVVSSTI